RVDVDVGREAGRLVERADTNEAELRPHRRIVAPQGDPAARASQEGLGPAAGARHRDGLGKTGQRLDAVGFDQGVEREGAAAQALAFAAVTGMDEEGAAHPEANLAAGAAAFEELRISHGIPPLPDGW